MNRMSRHRDMNTDLEINSLTFKVKLWKWRQTLMSKDRRQEQLSWTPIRYQLSRAQWKIQNDEEPWEKKHENISLNLNSIYSVQGYQLNLTHAQDDEF